MLSYVSTFFNYLLGKSTEDEDDVKEDFLADELIDLELKNEQNQYNTDPKETCDPPKNAVCFQRSGLITYISDEYVLIDGMFYYDTSTCSLHLNINDKVLYLGYKDENDSIVIVRILENQGLYWGEETEAFEENKFEVIDHVIIGEVASREGRYVYIKEDDEKLTSDYLKFNLDDVEATFIPTKGDWLELKCRMQWNEDKPFDVAAAQVLEVTSFRALRTKIINAVVTDWNGDCGTCNRQIYFNKHSFQNGTDPKVGSKVIIEAIESNQGICTWRAVKLIASECDSIENDKDTNNLTNGDDLTLELEKEKNIDISYPIKFDNIDVNGSAEMILKITNNSDQIQTVNKWIILGKKRDSQVNINPFLNRPKRIFPKQTFALTVTCQPKFLGNTKECLIIMFRGFQVKRYIDISVVDKFSLKQDHNVNSRQKTESEKLDNMKKVRVYKDMSVVPGQRPVKPPAFIPVKLGNFPIPEKIWSIVLGDSEQTIYGSDFNRILDRIETSLPFLLQDLNINNYIDKWHTLLYMEEIQNNISMRVYDMDKAFLGRQQDYLSLEINGLSEKRPSLIKGDKVIVKDIWNDYAPRFEGYIHEIKGDLILMKFHQQFHETYNGSDVSIEFHFTRTIYRRSHQAINLALSNLGVDILFPSRFLTKPYQLLPEKLAEIKWFNKNFNTGQKAAVTNILLGECRPLPYCIFGPPGTGKTITVIETILQILTQFPDSRILVATPSNSAANLITERLLLYKNTVSSSIIRLIANYLLDSDNIPDLIKPFCATLDLAREGTAKSKQTVQNGVNLHCRTSFVGRHRVTIGTCYCIGTLAQMGLPRGHFTHIIVDEAGQATEPEIMIPMTFIDKQNGQIVLAGDPMQLGPVILSKYCKEYGMDESYLSRILDTYPYQKDFDAFENGFNNKLITKLNDNYRSLQEVLTLPSEMFYDGTLVAKIDRSEPWVSKMTQTISQLFESDEQLGGIYVYGIRGYNTRAEDSPSWYNPQEASMVALTTCKLYKKNISPDDIGIITPYIAQIKHLRVLFQAMGLPQPKIGTVEEFQGQERPVILISTVRSTESYLKEDQKHSLGFVKSPKRLNVALTRAQVAVLLFCDPHLLCKDPLWKKVISHSVKQDKYMGCDLPLAFKHE